MIRLPVNFTESFVSPTCTVISGFTSSAGTDLNCEYLESIRLLTIEEGFPTTFTELQFTLSGVTNPPYANETDFFKVESFSTSGGEFIPLESSNDIITIIPTPGTLAGESMALADTEVCAYSELTLGLTTWNSIPLDGYIRIFFPKWNPFATSQSQMESYISTSTSPGSVPCSESFYTGGLSFDCVFTKYDEYDVLQINFEDNLVADLPERTSL